MADMSDVEQSLVDAITAAICPSGPLAPSALPGSSSPDVRVFRGAPNSAQLDLDLKAGIVNVSVMPLAGFTREATRYPLSWITITPAATTLSVAVAGREVTFSGAAGLPQLAGIRSGGLPHVVQVAPTDTPATVAAALAALVPGATCAGAVVTVPSALGLAARVSGMAVIGRELRRQAQGMKVTIFASTPPQRDAAVSLIDAALAADHFLGLPDGFCARLKYSGTFTDDCPEKEALWKRDLRYVAEYPTTETKAAPAVIWGVVQQAANGFADPDATI